MSDVTLKEHLETRLKDLDRIFDVQLASLSALVVKAEGQLNVRLEAMNEFRDALRDQASRLATRQEMELVVAALEKRLHNLELTRADLEGKVSSIAAVWSAAVSIVVGVVIVVVSKFLFK